MDLQAVVSILGWVLEIELYSSGKAIHSLNCWAIFPAWLVVFLLLQTFPSYRSKSSISSSRQMQKWTNYITLSSKPSTMPASVFSLSRMSLKMMLLNHILIVRCCTNQKLAGYSQAFLLQLHWWAHLAKLFIVISHSVHIWMVIFLLCVWL